MKRTIVTTLLLACFLSSAAAATLPKEFQGVWVAARETGNECKKADWGPEKTNDALINVTANHTEAWESGCDIRSVRTASDQPPGSRTAEVSADCGGEGFLWFSREIWHVQNVDGRKILTITELGVANYRTDDGRKAKNPRVNEPSAGIYLECK